MEHGKYDGPIVSSESMNGGGSASPFLQPRYNSEPVQEALQYLSSVDLKELCNEAKVEHCRATRDLRSCARPVESILISCRHASLCVECSQRCDICPICRTPIPKSGNRLQLRLYYKCVEAHLISKPHDGRSQEKEDDLEAHLTDDVKRLYSLFDVALDNNLSCLVGHYVTDVCMDETAVSSDPVVAFLLDEVVVKDWCKRTFRKILSELRGIYILEGEELESGLESILKCSTKLYGLSHVLEVLELSLKGTLSAKLDDLQHLNESVLKTKQHAEMMMWCIRHHFLENVRSRYTELFSWRRLVRERKTAAIARSWPESGVIESIRQDSASLFIEDALLNLDINKGDGQQGKFDLEIASLQKKGGSSLLRCKIEGLVGLYPFESLRSIVDILFLYGSSDMVVAKQAIFLYYLFDRHWKIPEEEWRHIVDDFAASFGITRHSRFESLTFYLLDDHTDDALTEACHLLPEISGPDSHPKIARVLLERQNPDAALMFLRWSGRDGGIELVSLCDAVTSVRVRIECGLLTEAFMYQRSCWMKVKERQLKSQHPLETSCENMDDEVNPWAEWVDVLVTEICCLCIRRNLVDRMIELPWSFDEEKYLHKCLFDCAVMDPSSNIGSLLVVFYLQRYCYIDAYHVDRLLQKEEQDFVSQNKNVSEGVLLRMTSTRDWRAGLINKSIGLLPEVQQQQLRAGKLPENFAWSSHSSKAAEGIGGTEPPEQDPVMPTASATMPSLLLSIGHESTLHKPSSFSGMLNSDRSHTRDLHVHGDFASPSKPGFVNVNSAEIGLKSKFSFNFGDVNSMTPSSKDIHPRASRRAVRTSHHDQSVQQLDEFFTPEGEQNGFLKRSSKSSSPYTRRIMAKPAMTTPSTLQGLQNDDSQEIYRTARRSENSLGVPDRSQAVTSPSDDVMDPKWSHEENGSTVEDLSRNGGARWRSDETSEDEEQSPSRTMTWTRRSRRGRLTRR